MCTISLYVYTTTLIIRGNYCIGEDFMSTNLPHFLLRNTQITINTIQIHRDQLALFILTFDLSSCFVQNLISSYAHNASCTHLNGYFKIHLASHYSNIVTFSNFQYNICIKYVTDGSMHLNFSPVHILTQTGPYFMIVTLVHTWLASKNRTVK